MVGPLPELPEVETIRRNNELLAELARASPVPTTPRTSIDSTGPHSKVESGKPTKPNGSSSTEAAIRAHITTGRAP